MKADIGRLTFDPAKQFLRVLMQQGRVQLEADWNEQVAILLQAQRALAADLIGPWGGSAGAFGLEEISNVKGDFSIGQGYYYVDGIRCENQAAAGTTVSYMHQPHYPLRVDQRLSGPEGGGQQNYLAYLDIWERLITAAEDEDIREVALGGPDTAARTQVVWQVRVGRVDDNQLDPYTCQNMPERWPGLLELMQTASRGRLRARAKVDESEMDRPCAIDPRAAYRHDENALIRVEVHAPGPVGTATFKWSLDNGAVAFPIDSFAGCRLRLTTLGRDARMTLEAGNWVELEYDSYVLRNQAEPLFLVKSVDYGDLMVTLDRAASPVLAGEHPRLRRWDQTGTPREPLEADGTIKIAEVVASSDTWVALRYGVQVQFVASASPTPATRYRTGDFWLIPARVSIGDVLWPKVDDPSDGKVPASRPPHGVEHHYAPLAWVAVDGDGTVQIRLRFVRTINPQATCPGI